jgi:hypothetical protein
MNHLTLFFFLLILFVIYNTTVQDQIQTANFQTFPGVEYITTKPYNILANITSKSVSSVLKCTQQCVQYPFCETVTYYIQTKICLLFREKYGLVQVNNVGTQTASMSILNDRKPAGNVKERYCVRT